MSSKNIKLAAAVSLSLAILGLFAYQSLLPIGDPTPKEYAVYSSLIGHLAADEFIGRKKLAVVSPTQEHELVNLASDDIVPEGTPRIPIPHGLGITKAERLSFPSFRDFCGSCATDFRRKNVKNWNLRASSEWLLRVLKNTTLKPDGDTGMVTLSRVGFNVWQTRAVLKFTVDCSDAATSTLCVGFGEAYLKLKDGQWTVEKEFVEVH
jgi:hypothetical protein